MSTEVLIKAVLKFLKKYLQHMILFPVNTGCISPTLSFSSLGCHIRVFGNFRGSYLSECFSTTFFVCFNESIIWREVTIYEFSSVLYLDIQGSV